MATFNELLSVHGIDPVEVILLRHTGQRGPRGYTVHELWRMADGSFDRYQSTQAPNKTMFELPIWASFVSDPANETLFVGLYRSQKGDRSEIHWDCPMTGVAPGQHKGRPSDFYRIEPLDVLGDYRGSLKIEWDRGWVGWARYAQNDEFAIVGDVDGPFAAFEASPEGKVTWRNQRDVERNSRLAAEALSKNAAAHGGEYSCVACDFSHSDRGMFDAHHLHPLNYGPRLSRTSDLIVLCPMCHRRAHRSGNRMVPYDLAALRAWNEASRP